MILIYTNTITPRLRYIFKHIFSRILNIDINFTTKVEEFVAFNGAKMSYSKVPLGNEFFIKSHHLLFEQGVNLIDIDIFHWEGIPYFFPAGKKSAIPFDIFASSFYLLSRYEEYLPHVKDDKKRFSAKNSLAYQNGFLEKPLVDIWAYKLLSTLKERFPDYNYKKRKFNFISTINVNEPFLYKNKGFVRGFIGVVRDILKLKPIRILHRIVVALNIKKDPYDTFGKLIKYQRKYDFKTNFFFLISNVSSFNTNLQILIKNIVDYALVGIQPSKYTMDNGLILKNEKERLEEITHMPMTHSRQHLLCFSLPKTYQNLIDLEIEQDYSMGYDDIVGFRASTCTPFYFYDMDFEIQTPLKVYPFAFMDKALKNMKLTSKQSLGKIRDLKNEVANVEGTLISIFHNDSIGGYLETWGNWKKVYENMLKMIYKK